MNPVQDPPRPSALPPVPTTPPLLYALPPGPTTPPLADTLTTQAALEDWRQSRQSFNRLLRLAPGTRQIIDELLHDLLGSGAQHFGLRVNEADAPQVVSLPALCLVVHHHPAAPDNLDARASVTGTADGPASLTELAPSALYARLASLDLVSALRQRWRDYWQARDKGTRWSRLEHARRLYHKHFMATLQIAQDQGLLTPSEQRPLVGLLENPEWRVFEGQQVQLQSPSCLPGALVISLEDEPLQVLYAPAQAQAFTAYASLAALETALPAAAQGVIAYTPLDAISEGFTALFETLEAALLGTLAHDPGGVVDPGAPHSLRQADQLQRSWQHSQAFAEAPAAPDENELDGTSRSLTDFGNLGLDLSATLRRELIGRQFERLDALDEQQASQYQQHQHSLRDAQARVRAEVDTLTTSAKWQSDAEPVTANAALVQAHRDGLLAHAQVQHLLGQLNDHHLGWVVSLLEGREGEAIAAHIELLPETADEGPPSVLAGVLAITTKSALLAPDADQGLLLYWLGEHGGLLQCDNRHELEQCFKTTGSLQLSALSNGALEHALNSLISAARQEKDTLQANLGLEALAAELPRLREELALSLQLPQHAAREAAQQWHSTHETVIAGVGASIGGLEKIPASQRQPLRTLLDDYFKALRRAQTLIQRDLPDRQAFCLERINRRLRQDFEGFDNSAIRLDLPVSVTFTGWDVVSGSGAPGTPVKRTFKPSDTRETLPLESILLAHVDDTMSARLNHLRLLVESQDETLRQALQNGIDSSYLQNLANTLDLAGHYDRLIIHAFTGVYESEFEHAFRRETLLEPHRLILQLQNLLFHSSGHLDDTSQAMLAQVIDARSQSEYQANGHDLRLLAAILTSGGPDTDDQPVTLAGVTFIEDRTRKTTLLYLPDHPSHPLRRYPDLETARRGLFDASTDSRERDYLASRALIGNPAAHHSRLNQAHAHRFDGIIGIGAQWPTSKSLAEVQLDSHMGQLLLAHRSTSRSNLDLYMENLAAQAGKVLLGFKIALGVIPFLGLPVSLYDLYNAAAELVQAVSEGDSLEVLDALQNVLASVIDVGLDLIGAGGGISTSGLRQAARQHQLRQVARQLPKLHHSGTPPRDRLASLIDYQVAEAVDLEGLTPASQGHYRGVYRHAQGTFIRSQGRQYQVQWDPASHTWELTGNANNRYRRAIALDEDGEWDTHLALFGVHRQGAGAGGGQALGHLAEALDPLWPAAVRERLPRWWRDQTYRRHNRLKNSIQTGWSALRSRGQAINQRTRRIDLEVARDPAITAELQACIADAERLHADSLAFSQVSSGNSRSRALRDANELAIFSASNALRLLRMALLRTSSNLKQVGELEQLFVATHRTLDSSLTPSRFAAIVTELMTIKARTMATRLDFLGELDHVRQYRDRLLEWRSKASPRAGAGEQGQTTLQTIDQELRLIPQRTLDFLEVTESMWILVKLPPSLDGGWINLQHLMAPPWTT